MLEENKKINDNNKNMNLIINIEDLRNCLIDNNPYIVLFIKLD